MSVDASADELLDELRHAHALVKLLLAWLEKDGHRASAATFEAAMAALPRLSAPLLAPGLRFARSVRGLADQEQVDTFIAKAEYCVLLHQMRDGRVHYP